jgi:hypothetical protein
MDRNWGTLDTAATPRRRAAKTRKRKTTKGGKR